MSEIHDHRPDSGRDSLSGPYAEPVVGGAALLAKGVLFVVVEDVRILCYATATLCSLPLS